jgi:hypothetical protein
MQLARPVFRRRRRHRVEEGDRSPIGGAKGGLPLFLTGGGKARARNFGSISGSIEEQEAARDGETAREEMEEELPVISGEGAPAHATAFGLALRGRTDANFSNSFATENAQAARARDCSGCGGNDCIRATGTLVSTFQVATTVTLPSVDDFPDLTPCQRERVQSAITNVLAPHEQQHVAAFQTYNGTVRTAFNLKLCRADFDARIQSLHDGIAAARRASAQAASDALDPFNFEVDINCQEPPPTSAPGAGTTPSPGNAVSPGL